MSTGKKHDEDKNRLDLLHVLALDKIGKVLTYGAKKYSPDNWRQVPDLYRRYYAALLRHMFAWWRGEKFDSETGITHLAHAGACILFLLAAEEENIQEENQPKGKPSGKERRKSRKSRKRRTASSS